MINDEASKLNLVEAKPLKIIFVAIDDKELGLTMAFLRKRGFQTLFCDNPARIMDTVVSESPTCVMLSWNFPNLDVILTEQMMREKHNIPCVVFTETVLDEETKTKIKNSSIKYYIPVPVSGRNTHSILKKIMAGELFSEEELNSSSETQELNLEELKPVVIDKAKIQKAESIFRKSGRSLVKIDEKIEKAAIQKRAEFKKPMELNADELAKEKEFVQKFNGSKIEEDEDSDEGISQKEKKSLGKVISRLKETKTNGSVQVKDPQSLRKFYQLDETAEDEAFKKRAANTRQESDDRSDDEPRNETHGKVIPISKDEKSTAYVKIKDSTAKDVHPQIKIEASAQTINKKRQGDAQRSKQGVSKNIGSVNVKDSDTAVAKRNLFQVDLNSEKEAVRKRETGEKKSSLALEEKELRKEKKLLAKMSEEEANTKKGTDLTKEKTHLPKKDEKKVSENKQKAHDHKPTEKKDIKPPAKSKDQLAEIKKDELGNAKEATGLKNKKDLFKLDPKTEKEAAQKRLEADKRKALAVNGDELEKPFEKKDLFKLDPKAEKEAAKKRLEAEKKNELTIDDEELKKEKNLMAEIEKKENEKKIQPPPSSEPKSQRDLFNLDSKTEKEAAHKRIAHEKEKALVVGDEELKNEKELLAAEKARLNATDNIEDKNKKDKSFGHLDEHQEIEQEEKNSMSQSRNSDYTHIKIDGVEREEVDRPIQRFEGPRPTPSFKIVQEGEATAEFEVTEGGPQALQSKRLESLLEKCVRQAIEVLASKSEVETLLPLGATTNIDVIPIHTKRFKGLLILDFGGKEKLGKSFLVSFKKHLTLLLAENGETMEDEGEFSIMTPPSNFIEFAKEQGLFLIMAEHKGCEIGVAFLENKAFFGEVISSNSEEMIEVSADTILPGRTLTFNVYIYLPINNKYLLYIKSGGHLFETQKNKLNKFEITHVFVKRTDSTQLKKYLATIFVEEAIKRAA